MSSNGRYELKFILDESKYTDEIGLSLTLDSLENVYATGSTGFTSNMLTVKYNDTGLLSTVAFDINSTGGKDVELDRMENTFIMGSSYNSLGNTCITIWKYNTSLQPITKFGADGKVIGCNNNIHTIGNDMLLDSEFIYVTGQSEGKMILWRYKQ